MTVAELIDELEKYEKTLEVVTCDGYGSVDEILKVSVEKVNDRDDIVPSDSFTCDEDKAVLVIGWNH
jgi:hypothetical protein